VNKDYRIDVMGFNMVDLFFHEISLEGATHFSILKPLELTPDHFFTFRGEIELKDIKAQLDVQLSGHVTHRHDFKLWMDLVKPRFVYEVSLGFDFADSCSDLFPGGSALHISNMDQINMTDMFNCMASSVFYDPKSRTQGVKFHQFDLTADSVTARLDETASSLGPRLSLIKKVVDAINKLLHKIIEINAGKKMEMVDKMVIMAMNNLGPVFKERPCSHYRVPASRVCLNNNAGAVMKVGVDSCADHCLSTSVSFPIDQERCLDMKDVFPNMKTGQTFRVRTIPVGGYQAFAGPGFVYKEGSNIAGLTCSGVLPNPVCAFDSIAPMDGGLAQIQTICILNQAGFVMEFDAVSDAGMRAEIYDWYPINEMRCADLSSTGGAPEQDIYTVTTYAMAGRTQLTYPAKVQYVKNGLKITFVCRGTTLNYHCNPAGM